MWQGVQTDPPRHQAGRRQILQGRAHGERRRAARCLPPRSHFAQRPVVPTSTTQKPGVCSRRTRCHPLGVGWVLNGYASAACCGWPRHALGLIRLLFDPAGGGSSFAASGLRPGASSDRAGSIRTGTSRSIVRVASPSGPRPRRISRSTTWMLSTEPERWGVLVCSQVHDADDVPAQRFPSTTSSGQTTFEYAGATSGRVCMMSALESTGGCRSGDLPRERVDDFVPHPERRDGYRDDGEGHLHRRWEKSAVDRVAKAIRTVHTKSLQIAATENSHLN